MRVLKFETVIKKLIIAQQTGFIKGRFIGENLRLASDIISDCEEDDIEALLVACDYRRAFDSLKHEFIYSVLKAYNFGENLILWVTLLHSDAHLAIITNGYTSFWFQCTRRTFQVSPVSSLIFVPALEIIALHIGGNSNIKGIIVGGVEVKLSLYVDVMVLYAADKESAETAIEVIKSFSTVYGLSLNEDKNYLLWLGASKDRRDPVGGMKAKETIKYIGVYPSARRQCQDDNFEPICKKIVTFTHLLNLG